MGKFDADFERLVVRLYRRLHSTVKVSARLQLGTSTIWHILNRRGIKLPARGSAEAHKGILRFKGAQEKAVALAYASGAPMQSLCKKYSCSAQAIRNAVLRTGGSIRVAGGINRIRKWTESEIAKMAELHEKGWSQTNIAIEFHTTQTRVSKLLIGAGESVREQYARGSRHSSWRGGKYEIEGGYVGVLMSREDPLFCMARSNHYALEHRLMMARSLGRPLSRHETVHHINGDKKDNRVENLQLRQGHHGTGTVARCADCGSHNIIRARLADAQSNGA